LSTISAEFYFVLFNKKLLLTFLRSGVRFQFRFSLISPGSLGFPLPWFSGGWGMMGERGRGWRGELTALN